MSKRLAWRQIVANGRKVFGLCERLRGAVDLGRAPATARRLIAAAVVYTARAPAFT
jgi:hypothetical protein